MEVANTFAVTGELMDFALSRRREGHPIPTGLFIEIITEKCQLINKYLHSIRDCLLIVVNITNNKASIQFHDIHYTDSKMHCVTLSNVPDLENQLVYLWTELQEFLTYFHLEDPVAELDSIKTFYRHLAYDQFMQADFEM